MKLDLRPLLAEKIRTLPVDFCLTPPTEEAEGGATNLYGVHFPGALQVSGSITNTAGYMQMALSATIPYTSSCARCLDEVTGTFSFRFEKTVAPAKLLTNLSEEEADDYVIVEDGFLDIDEQLYEMLLLEFPTKLLCREDCAGLCPQCGKNLNSGACSCTKKETDPRLAPLAAWLARHREEEPKGEK